MCASVPRAWVRSAAAAVRLRLCVLSPVELPLVLWALAKLGFVPGPGWMDAYWREVVRRLPELHARGLCCVLHATAWLGYLPSAGALAVGTPGAGGPGRQWPERFPCRAGSWVRGLKQGRSGSGGRGQGGEGARVRTPSVPFGNGCWPIAPPLVAWSLP
jgi:hypothetical protein